MEDKTMEESSVASSFVMEESSVASSFVVQKDDQSELHDDAFRAFPQFGSSIDPGSVEGMQALNKNERRYNYKEQAKQRKLKAIVNKLTPQNFDRLIQQVKDVNIDTVVTLTGVISLIFQTLDATTSETYANFCIHLDGVLPVFSTSDETITFRKLLVNQCQKEFHQGGREEAKDNRVEKLKEEDMEEKVKSRRRWIGNIQLIGELYKKRMFREIIMHVCIVELLKKEDGEALSILIRIVGEEIDSLRSKRLMDALFYKMQKLSNDQKLPSRVRFMLKDTIDLRKNKWHQRKFERVETEKVYSGTSKELSSVPRRMFHAGSGFGSARTVKYCYCPNEPVALSSPVTPLMAMHKAERKLEIGIASAKEGDKQRQLEAILNKLTPLNFEKQFEKIKEVDIDSAATLTGLVSQICDRAVMNPTFCEMYANLCHHLAGALPDFSEDNEKITFKRLLLNKCQEEFERGEREQAEANRVEEGEIKQSDEEREEERVQARRRMLGNIQLIGELYNKKVLTEKIMHECIKKLLGQYQNPDEEDIEALCKLMSTIGEMIDHPKAKEHMDAYFDVMLKLSNNQKLSSRVRFMLKDAIDLRKNNWQQRRKFASHLVDRDSYSNSGRIIDRASGGSRNDRRGSGIVDDDKWGKAPGSFGSGRDPRMDGTHGGMAENFRPGQAGNHGVLRNPRGQSSGQYVGGILSGPLQALASPGGIAWNGPDVDRWQRAKGLIPAPPTPLQAVHKADRKYKIGKVSDREESKQRQLKAILNKLTPQNFDKLFQQVKQVNIDSAATLTGVISQIFDKALMEPTFCEMYANFCHHLAGALPDFGEDNEKITFKRLLLNKCQEEFERGEIEQAEANRVEEGEIKQSAEEREEKRVKARRRMLGNIQLIGELYNKKMLTERVMHECIKKLLGQYQNPDEEDIKALCKLMSRIGEMIDHPKAKEHMDAYFDVMLKLSNNQKLSYRVRFMLKDTIDLRNNKWHQRRKFDWVETKEVYSDTSKELSPLGHRASQSHAGFGSNYARRGKQTRYYPQGPASLSSQFSLPKGTLYDLPHRGSQCMTRGLQFQDGHPSESRTLPGSFPRRLARVQSPMPSIPLADVSSTGAFSDLRSTSMETIWEYYVARDDDEVRLCIKELNAPRFYPKMVKLWIEDSFDRVNDIDRDLLAKLLVKLSNSNDLSRAQLIFGFKSVLSILEDAVIDYPNAAKYFGHVLGKVIVLESIFCLTLIGNLILKGGSKPGRLVQIGIASDILLSILDTIRAEKGESVLNEMWTGSNLRLEDFQPPDTSESLSFEEFIRKMTL